MLVSVLAYQLVVVRSFTCFEMSTWAVIGLTSGLTNVRLLQAKLKEEVEASTHSLQMQLEEVN